MTELTRDGWQDVRDQLSVENFAEARATAEHLAAALAIYPQTETGAEIAAIIAAAEKFTLIATNALAHFFAPDAAARVFVDGRERRAQLEVRDGELWAIGKRHAKPIKIDAVNPQDLLAALDAAGEATPEMAVGGLAMLAAGGKASAEFSALTARDGGAAARQARLLADLAAGAAPLWTFANANLSPEEQEICQWENGGAMRALRFTRPGIVEFLAMPLPLKNLRLQLALSDDAELELRAPPVTIAFARRGGQIGATLIDGVHRVARDFPLPTDEKLTLAFGQREIHLGQPSITPNVIAWPEEFPLAAHLFFRAVRAGATVRDFRAAAAW
jgi:hypothetical protein